MRDIAPHIRKQNLPPKNVGNVDSVVLFCLSRQKLDSYRPGCRSGAQEAVSWAKKLVQLLAILAVALYFVPTGAHLFELPHKMALSPTEYRTVQQIYAGWELFGIVIAIALLATLANTLLVRADRRAFAWSLAAFLALATTQAVFWAFTYPVNVATRFSTVSPAMFEAARRQWEYSHAASAVLTFVAFVAMVFSSLTYRAEEDRRTSQS